MLRKTPNQSSDKTGWYHTATRRCTHCKKVKPLTAFYAQHYFTHRGMKKECWNRCCKECWATRNYKTRKLLYAPRLEYYRKRDRERSQKRYYFIKDAVFEAYGGYICACCGELEKQFLTLDHVNNDGAKWRAEIFGKKGSRYACGRRTYYYLWRKNFPPGFQILCMNCQHGKRMNKGICPHRTRRNDYPHEGVEPSGSKRSVPKKYPRLVKFPRLVA